MSPAEIKEIAEIMANACNSQEYFLSLHTKRKQKLIMCTLSVRMDDNVIDRVKPLFGGDKAMNKWIETVLHKAMEEYADQYEQMAGKNALAEALTKRLKELEGDPEALFKMSGILGKPQAGFSWDELREEAIYEKYKV
jgi:hypothetical protein